MTSRILTLCIALGLVMSCCGAGCNDDKKTNDTGVEYATVGDLEGLRKEVEAKPSLDQITGAFNNALATKSPPAADPNLKALAEFMDGLKKDPKKTLGLPDTPATSIKDDVAAGVTAAFEARDKKEEEKAAARKEAEAKEAKEKRDQETNEGVRTLKQEVQELKGLLTDPSKRVIETNVKPVLERELLHAYGRAFRVHDNTPFPLSDWPLWCNWYWKGIAFTVWVNPRTCAAHFIQQKGGHPTPDAGKQRNEESEVLRHKLKECEDKLKEQEAPPTGEKKEVVIIREHGGSRCGNPACDFCHPRSFVPPARVIMH